MFVIDDKNFFRGVLHVFYALELYIETLAETRIKLIQHHEDVITRIKSNRRDLVNPVVNRFVPKYV